MNIIVNKQVDITCFDPSLDDDTMVSLRTHKDCYKYIRIFQGEQGVDIRKEMIDEFIKALKEFKDER